MLFLYVTNMQCIIIVSVLLMFTTTIIGKTEVELKGPNVCDKLEDKDLNLKRIKELSDGHMVFPDEYEAFLNNQNLTNSITKECCDGYIKNKLGDRCIPFCTECKHGECVAPEECRCYPGFKGTSCKISCPEGYHGQDCSHMCSCKNDASCGKDNGFCECRPGFIGTNCEIVCPEGYVGEDCLKKRKPDTPEPIWKITTPYLAAIILCVISIVGVIVCALICYHHKVVIPNRSSVHLKHKQKSETTTGEYHHLNHLGATSIPKQHYQQINGTHAPS